MIKFSNKIRVAKLEDIIRKKGESKVFVMRDLKDMIIYYSDYGENSENRIPGDPPLVDNQLDPQLRNFINNLYQKHAHEDEEDEIEMVPFEEQD